MTTILSALKVYNKTLENYINNITSRVETTNDNKINIFSINIKDLNLNENIWEEVKSDKLIDNTSNSVLSRLSFKSDKIVIIENIYKKDTIFNFHIHPDAIETIYVIDGLMYDMVNNKEFKTITFNNNELHKVKALKNSFVITKFELV